MGDYFKQMGKGGDMTKKVEKRCSKPRHHYTFRLCPDLEAKSQQYENGDAAFYLNNREAKRALNVYNNGNLLPPCPVPTSLGVKLDRSFIFRHHLEALRKKLSTQVALLRRHAGSGCGAGAKTMRISALSLVYSTTEYCAPVWCSSTPTRLIDSIVDDALRIVTGCLRPTPTKDLPVLAGIQPPELRRLGATLFLANHAIHNPDYVLHRQLDNVMQG